VASRREQKEALRREREERERQAKAVQARKRLVGYGTAGALVLAAAVVAVVLLAGGGGAGASSELLPGGGSVPKQAEFDLTAAAKAAGCKLRAVKANGVADHTQDPKERVKYDSNPPTNGRHFIVPADDGEYSDAPTDEQLVHNLEHGRVIIWFKPTLPKDERADLNALFNEDSYQVLLVPRSGMPYQVAASAWNGEPRPAGVGRLLTCDRTSAGTWDALRTFRDEHRSNGPEAIP
jgi:Protein of unknown function (DUF3105)